MDLEEDLKNLAIYGCSFSNGPAGNYSELLCEYMDMNYLQYANGGFTNDMIHLSFMENEALGSRGKHIAGEPYLDFDYYLLQMTTPYRFNLWIGHQKDIFTGKKDSEYGHKHHQNCLLQYGERLTIHDELWNKGIRSRKYKFGESDVMKGIAELITKKEREKSEEFQVWMQHMWLYESIIRKIVSKGKRVIFLPYLFTDRPYIIGDDSEKGYRYESWGVDVSHVKSWLKFYVNPENVCVSEHNPWHYYDRDPEINDQRDDHLTDEQHLLCSQKILKDVNEKWETL